MRIEAVFPVISTTVWGMSIVGGKILGGNSFTPIEITFGRFAISSLIFLPILLSGMRKNRNFLPRNKKTWWSIFGLSLSGVAVNNIVFYQGLSLTSASVASLLVSINPLMAMLFGAFLLKESLSWRKIASVILGIIGVAFIVGVSHNTGNIGGNLLILLAATIWASSFSFSKQASNDGMSSVAITGWSIIIGTILIFPIVLVNNSLPKYFTFKSDVIFWFLFMGIISSVMAYILHYRAIEVFGAGKIAPSTNIIPFSGAFTSWLLLNDNLEFSAIIGFFLIICAILIVHLDKN